MAKATGLLADLHGRVGKSISIRHLPSGPSTYPAHIEQPHRLSRKQLAVRQRQSHNNALWRALKESKHVFFEGSKSPCHRFMSLNMECPIPYIPKDQYHSGNALLLPNMVLSDGPLQPISYQLGEVDIPSVSADAPSIMPALFTDLTKTEAKKDTLLLYVLQQRVLTHQNAWPDQFYLTVKAVPVALDEDCEIPHIGTVRFVTVPSTLLMPYQNPSGTLALVGDLFADRMLGFGLVRVIDGHASSQRVVTRCTYYERYTTEEALQLAAKSHKGLTGEQTL